jgi:anaerobic ribonucleoside-triphosphate reductase
MEVDIIHERLKRLKEALKWKTTTWNWFAEAAMFTVISDAPMQG